MTWITLTYPVEKPEEGTTVTVAFNRSPSPPGAGA